MADSTVIKGGLMSKIRVEEVSNGFYLTHATGAKFIMEDQEQLIKFLDRVLPYEDKKDKDDKKNKDEPEKYGPQRLALFDIEEDASRYEFNGRFVFKNKKLLIDFLSQAIPVDNN